MIDLIGNRNEIYYLSEKMREISTPARYVHIMGVMNTAGNLAIIYNEDINKAMLAGLLHDCTKCITIKEHEYILKKANIEKPINPSLYHAITGSFVAKEKYGVTDIDVLNAIRWHTTGKENMTDLEKIIYLADYIEPSRKAHDKLAEARRLTFTVGLNEAMRFVLKSTIDYLLSGGASAQIDKNSENAYNYYKNI